MSTPTAPSARDLAILAAANPAPAAVQRGPVAKLHWRHGLDVDPALAAVVVDTPETPREWSALLAETHASLLDPDGVSPLPHPSPVGRSVVSALEATPAWQTLRDASETHPMIAREAVTSLAGVVLDALKRAGATKSTDTRASLAALDAARAALERARAAQRDAKTPTEVREALRKVVDAQSAEERAVSEVAVAEGIARRAGETLDGPGVAALVQGIADDATERSEAAHAFSAALGSASGVGGALAIGDDVLKALTPEVVAMLVRVGAMRRSLDKGRAARHVRGREGMVGVTQGGIEHAGDLTALSLAGLAGHLGAPMRSLVTLALVEGRADVTEKGGGIARNGHVVVVLDKSGSMRMGGRETWAGALAVAVILEARSDGRVVGLVSYDGSVRASMLVDSPATLATAITVCMERSGGDNNEHAALLAASSLLASMPQGGDPADCLLLTDGQWEASNIHGTGFDRGGPNAARLRGVFIGGHAPVGAGFASTWEIKSTEGADADALAVTIAETVV